MQRSDSLQWKGMDVKRMGGLVLYEWVRDDVREVEYSIGVLDRHLCLFRTVSVNSNRSSQPFQ